MEITANWLMMATEASFRIKEIYGPDTDEYMLADAVQKLIQAWVDLVRSADRDA